jgi:hypothetical protein
VKKRFRELGELNIAVEEIRRALVENELQNTECYDDRPDKDIHCSEAILDEGSARGHLQLPQRKPILWLPIRSILIWVTGTTSGL